MTEQEIRQIIDRELNKAYRPSLNLISIQAASNALDISRMSIYRMIKRGQLQLIKIGDRSYLKISEINELGKRE
ncbi:MAG: hypothetical protein ABJG47_13025 [Ekhidna sp.]